MIIFTCIVTKANTSYNLIHTIYIYKSLIFTFSDNVSYHSYKMGSSAGKVMVVSEVIMRPKPNKSGSSKISPIQASDFQPSNGDDGGDEYTPELASADVTPREKSDGKKAGHSETSEAKAAFVRTASWYEKLSESISKSSGQCADHPVLVRTFSGQLFRQGSSSGKLRRSNSGKSQALGKKGKEEIKRKMKPGYC